MWGDIISDDALLHLVGKHWILHIAADYLPPKFRDHLPDGLLVALSKRPKQHSTYQCYGCMAMNHS